jgi:hypothetical protein
VSGHCGVMQKLDLLAAHGIAAVLIHGLGEGTSLATLTTCSQAACRREVTRAMNEIRSRYGSICRN